MGQNARRNVWKKIPCQFGGKQDPEKINGSDYEVPMNNSKLVIKKAKAKVDIEESKVKA